MANAPWRCSECGTINEPVANACRTCGRWPSLFDLQESVVDDDVEPVQVEPEPFRHTSIEVEEPPTFETDTFEPETYDSRTFEAETFEAEVDTEVEAETEPEPESTRRRRRLASFLVPIAFAVYLAISIIFGER